MKFTYLMKKKPYDYVRWRWVGPLDMAKVRDTFSEKFDVKDLHPRTGRVDMAVFKYFREELLVSADNLKAYLAPQRAVLFQKVPIPFTKRDLEMREMVLKLYPSERITPIPIGFSYEPEFDVVEE